LCRADGALPRACQFRGKGGDAVKRRRGKGGNGTADATHGRGDRGQRLASLHLGVKSLYYFHVLQRLKYDGFSRMIFRPIGPQARWHLKCQFS
jgi:hypothetical protein